LNFELINKTIMKSNQKTQDSGHRTPSSENLGKNGISMDPPSSLQMKQDTTQKAEDEEEAAQGKNIQLQAEDEEMAQGKNIQLQAEEEEPAQGKEIQMQEEEEEAQAKK
jgi:hypothetical protein